MVHRFAARGLYNGLFLLGDRETGSYWDHVTGECLHGPLKGSRLAVHPLLHTTVAQALKAHPDLEVAISRLSWIRRLTTVFMELMRRSERGVFPPGFKRTMSEEDTRRPAMEIGLGVWTDKTQRFYPIASLRKRSGALIDKLDGRALLVYIDIVSGIPAAFYTSATRCEWQDQRLRLETGEIFHQSVLRGSRGQAQSLNRPIQMFTRWYGFAYTFPGCDIFAEQPIMQP